MREYVAIVFNQAKGASRALQELWQLDDDALLTVHGARVVFRKTDDDIAVEINDSQFPLAPGLGMIVGALLGALAGPAGAAVGAAGGAAIGAGSGAFGGISFDIANARKDKQAINEAGLVLPVGHYGVIADVDESDPQPLTQMAHSFGGALYRRKRSDVIDNKCDDFFRAAKPYRYDSVAADEQRS